MENDNIISDKIVLLDNKEELKEIFLNIISNGKYIYKDLLMEYFTDFDFDENFKIRYKKATVNEIKLSAVKKIISYFNDLFFEIDKLFLRDLTFPYRLVRYGILYGSSSNVKNTIKTIIYIGYEQNRIKENLVFLFFEGLSHTKNYCLIRYNGFCNKSSYALRRMTSSQRYELVKLLSINLKDESLLYIYRLNNLSQKQIENDEENNIYSLLTDLKSKINNINIEFQKLSQSNYDLTEKIYNYITKTNFDGIIIKNISLNYYNQNRINNILISLEIEIEKNIFCVILKHIYNELFFFIYYNNVIVYKDVCYRPVDFDRIIFVILKKYKLWITDKEKVC